MFYEATYRKANERNAPVISNFLMSPYVWGYSTTFANPSVPLQNVMPLDVHKLVKQVLLFWRLCSRHFVSDFITTCFVVLTARRFWWCFFLPQMHPCVFDVMGLAGFKRSLKSSSYVSRMSPSLPSRTPFWFLMNLAITYLLPWRRRRDSQGATFFAPCHHTDSFLSTYPSS